MSLQFRPVSSSSVLFYVAATSFTHVFGADEAEGAEHVDQAAGESVATAATNAAKNTGTTTGTTVWWTPSTAATKLKGFSDGKSTEATFSTGKTSAKTSTATTQSGSSTNSHGITYNQWGFTGSQSKWESESSSGSESSAHSVSQNSTSNANRAHGFSIPEKKFGWKSTFLVGSVLGTAFALNAL